MERERGKEMTVEFPVENFATCVLRRTYIYIEMTRRRTNGVRTTTIRFAYNYRSHGVDNATSRKIHFVSSTERCYPNVTIERENNKLSSATRPFPYLYCFSIFYSSFSFVNFDCLTDKSTRRSRSYRKNKHTSTRETIRRKRDTSRDDETITEPWGEGREEFAKNELKLEYDDIVAQPKSASRTGRNALTEYRDND